MLRNTPITVTLTPELRLEQALKDAGVKDPATVTGLTLAGSPTDDDFKYIRKKMRKTLQELDMNNASITEIGEWTFEGCYGLTSIAIPESVIEIGENAFEDCSASITVYPDNPVYTSENGKLLEKKSLKL
jgi:hypothetical protein